MTVTDWLKTTGREMQGADATRRPIRVLLAEDDDEMRNLLAGALRRYGYDVTDFADGEQLLYYLDQVERLRELRQISVIIADVRMPGFAALEILAGLRASEDAPPMILITACGDQETHVRAERLGAAAVFGKPFDVKVLTAKVHELTGHSQRES